MRVDWTTGWYCFAPNTFTSGLIKPVPVGIKPNIPHSNALILKVGPSKPGTVDKAMSNKPGK